MYPNLILHNQSHANKNCPKINIRWQWEFFTFRNSMTIPIKAYCTDDNFIGLNSTSFWLLQDGGEWVVCWNRSCTYKEKLATDAKQMHIQAGCRSSSPELGKMVAAAAQWQKNWHLSPVEYLFCVLERMHFDFRILLMLGFQDPSVFGFQIVRRLILNLSKYFLLIESSDVSAL